MAAEDQPRQKYFSAKELADHFGVSLATIWNWARRGLLPEPVRLSPRCTRWRASEIAELERKGGHNGDAK